MFGLSFGFAHRHGFRNGSGGSKMGRGPPGDGGRCGGDLLPAYGVGEGEEGGRRGVRRRHDAGSPMNGLMERAGRATQRARLTKRASSLAPLLSTPRSSRPTSRFSVFSVNSHPHESRRPLLITNDNNITGENRAKTGPGRRGLIYRDP
jgi:hypothetical protein